MAYRAMNYLLKVRFNDFAFKQFRLAHKLACETTSQNIVDPQDQVDHSGQPLCVLDSSTAKNHFHMLLKRYDRCQTHLDEHKIKNGLMKDAGHVCDRFLSTTANLGSCQRIGFIRALLRLLLEYDSERFETYVASRKRFAEPILELSAACRWSFDTRDFLSLLSLVVLLKERQSHEFDCLTPALISEAKRKVWALDSLQECVEILEALYRLFEYDAENVVFKECLKIFSQKAVGVVMQPRFSLSSYASLCYLLCVEPIPHADQSSILLNYVKNKSRRYYNNFDPEAYGMVLYFLIKNGMRNDKPRFKDALLNRLADERRQKCSHFARTSIRAYCDNLPV